MMEENGGLTGLRVALYERVSSRGQAEDGYSLDGQLHELRERMAKEGRRVVAEVTDPGEKRWMSTRPGLERIRDLAAAESIDEVWAWAWDRYGQSPIPEILAIELGEFGVTLRALDDGGEGLGGEIIRAVAGVLSREDQRNRVRKSRMGRRAKAMKGQVLGAGPRPRFGFRYVRNEKGRVVGYEVNPEEMAVVHRVFEMLAEGDSLYAVQAALERDGVKTPRGGNRWNRETIKLIVREDSYLRHEPEELAALVAEGLMSEEVLSGLDPDRTYGIAYHGRTRTSYVSNRSKKRKSEPVPRSEWTAVPVSLEGSGLERETVERARASIADNRAPSKVGDRFWELSRGFLFCADCGRSMSTTGRRFPERGTAYYHYRCDGPHQARETAPPCPNRKCHPAAVLEYYAASLFEESVSRETLIELYDRAIEERRNESGGLSRTLEKRATLSERLASLAAMRERFQRQEAEGLMTLDELRARLAELVEEKGRLTAELRAMEDEAAAARRIEAARASLSGAGASGYDPVHERWYEDPDAVHPDEVLTFATSPEGIRRAYRRYGARFEVDGEGELTLKLDLALDGGVLSLTSSRT